MDVDLMKSSSSSSSGDGQVHMDMMTMIMHMEKQLPDFSDPNFHHHNSSISISTTSTSSLQDIQFSDGNPTPSIISPTSIFPNPHANSSTLINHSLSMPFLGTAAIEEPPLTSPLQPQIDLLTTNKFKYNSPSFSNGNSFLSSVEKKNSTAAIREMIYRIAAMQPIHIDPESIKPPKRRNVKISKDPQSVAARHRRERISERIRILQRLVPGGTKMDTASMLDEAIHYVKFLKKQVQSLEQAGAERPMLGFGFSDGIPMLNNGVSYSPFIKNCLQPPSSYMLGSMQQQMLR